MEGTSAANVLQKLAPYFTITNNFFFVVLQAVADSESKFIFVDTGACGKDSDGGTLAASASYRFLEDFESALPKPASFDGGGTEMSFLILGDEVYPL